MNPNDIVDGEFLAAVIGRSERWVRELVGQGLPKRGRNQYPLSECVQWYLSRSSSDAEIGRQIQEQQLRKLTIDNDIKEANYLEKETVFEGYKEIAGIVASHLEGLPARMGQGDPILVERLEDEVRRLRRQVASKVEELHRDWSSGGDPDPEPEAGRGAVGGREPDTSAGQPGAGSVAN